MDDDQSKRIGIYALLAVTFIGALVAYILLVFPALTWLVGRSLGAKVHWDRAPLLYALLLYGASLLSAVVAAWGVWNLFHHQHFFHEVPWAKVVIVVFCLTLFMVLSGEVESLTVRHDTDEHEHWTIVHLFVVVLVGLVAYAMWPQKERPPRSEEQEEEESEDEEEEE